MPGSLKGNMGKRNIRGLKGIQGTWEGGGNGGVGVIRRKGKMKEKAWVVPAILIQPNQHCSTPLFTHQLLKNIAELTVSCMLFSKPKSHHCPHWRNSVYYHSSSHRPDDASPQSRECHPLSYEALIEFYHKLDFSKRAKTLELFLTEDAPLPKKSPPYPSSIFPERAKQIITVISYLLG